MLTDVTLPTDSLLGRPKIFFENLIKVVQENFSSTGRYTIYTNKIQDAIKISINKSIGECKDPKCIKFPQKVFSQLIARNIISIILGEANINHMICDDEIINTFASLTSDITRVLKFPPILNFIHKSIQRQFTINLIFERLSQIIEQREHEKNTLGDAWTPPIDILQTFVNFSTEDNSVDLQLLTDYIIEFIFISVQTTSDAIISILYEYGARPEYWKELLEENEMISNEVIVGYLDFNNIDKMVKLDSFVKESIKYWMPCVGLQRKTISDHFTFSNGYQVPKDRNINLYIANLHGTDQIGCKFDGFQYVGKDSPATKLGEEYIPFGRGRHACPGRFFAIHQIKLIMYFIIRKYKVTTMNRRIIKPISAGHFLLSPSDELIFENL
ncbi:cytochrome P450 [Gigaspora rosea]|uniref:Cytochrome P450 n=1 Tax=Gigaspora rosea TaxID=44941 RepID=A0A397V6S6_9GLOM|nr:cytochrome P450 [Gigaspora rosea]